MSIDENLCFIIHSTHKLAQVCGALSYQPQYQILTLEWGFHPMALWWGPVPL